MIHMSPEELLFTGKLLHAKYIDYDYVRLAGEIQDQYQLKEKEAMARLVKQGLLMEDFSGNLELDPIVESLLSPIFFGEFEAEIQFYDVLFEKKKIYKFHYWKDKVSAVEVSEHELKISSDGRAVQEDLRRGLLEHVSLEGNRSIPVAEMSLAACRKVVNIRTMQIGKKASGGQIVERDSRWYRTKDGKNAVELTADEINEWWRNMMGVEAYGVL